MDESNRVRDHLANERTYLAWLRTAIALLGFGIVIVKLRYMVPGAPLQRHGGWELGLVFALSGLLLILLATGHYFSVQRAIETDTYQPGSRWVMVCSIVTVLLGAGVVFYLLSSPSTPPAANVILTTPDAP